MQTYHINTRILEIIITPHSVKSPGFKLLLHPSSIYCLRVADGRVLLKRNTLLGKAHCSTLNNQGSFIFHILLVTIWKKKNLHWFMRLTNLINLAIYKIHLLYKQCKQQINMLRNILWIASGASQWKNFYHCFLLKKNHFSTQWQVFFVLYQIRKLIF